VCGERSYRRRAVAGGRGKEGVVDRLKRRTQLKWAFIDCEFLLNTAPGSLSLNDARKIGGNFFHWHDSNEKA